MPTVRGVQRDAARQDYRVSAFVQGIVKSQAFRMSRPSQTETTVADTPVSRTTTTQEPPCSSRNATCPAAPS